MEQISVLRGTACRIRRSETHSCFVIGSGCRHAAMSEEASQQSGPLNHADEKARLECDKLRAEIKAIGKPLFKTAGFYSAFAPVALAILGLVFTWSTGWFDVQRT